MRTSMQNRRRPWLGPLAVLGCALVFGGAARAQLDVNLGGLDEANAELYLEPLSGGLCSALGSGTFRTGFIPRDGFHFSIGLEGLSIGFEDDARLYRPVDPPGFISTEEKEVPTVIGDLESVPVAGEGGTTWYFPGGFDMEYLTLAAPELRIGCVYGTRAVLRFLVIELGDADIGDMQLWGIGAEHSLTQYMEKPPVDVAAGLMYESYEIGDVLTSDLFQLRITGSRAIYSWLEPYAGVGYDSYALKGAYTYTAEGEDQDIDLELDSENSFHGVVGVNFNLKGIYFHTEYNLAAESGVTVGFGFGK